MTTVCIDALITQGTQVLMIKRKHSPFKDMWALPGGKLEENETLEECLVREVKEETGLGVTSFKMLDVYSKPGRDPRGHYVSVLYKVTEYSGEIQAGDDAASARFMFISSKTELAFDHKQMLEEVGLVCDERG